MIDYSRLCTALLYCRSTVQVLYGALLFIAVPIRFCTVATETHVLAGTVRHRHNAEALNIGEYHYLVGGNLHMRQTFYCDKYSTLW